MMKIEQRVLAFIRQQELIPRGSTVIVAVSGGGDSVALLHILKTLRYTLSCKLHVAHFNHALRPANDEDQTWVLKLCQDLGVSCSSQKRTNSGGTASADVLNEGALREQRYRFLSDVAKSQTLPVLATAHQATDQAETFFLHLLRGAGLNGLQGIRPKSEYQQLPLVRPLLNLDRQTIERYLKQQRLTYLMDETNTDQNLFRNRIRHELMPLLRTYNPKVETLIHQTMNHIQSDYDYLADQIRKAFVSCIRSEGQTYRIERVEFQSFPEAIQRGLLNQCYKQVLAADYNMPAEALFGMLHFVHNTPMPDTQHCSGGVQLKALSAESFVMQKDAKQI